MDPADSTGKAEPATRAPDRTHGGAPPAAAGEYPFGPNGAAILATERSRPAWSPTSPPATATTNRAWWPPTCSLTPAGDGCWCTS